MICASVNRFFTSDLPFRMIGLSTEVLLKMGGTSRGDHGRRLGHPHPNLARQAQRPHGGCASGSVP